MSELDDDPSSNIVGNDVTKRLGPLNNRYKPVTCPLQTKTQVTDPLPEKWVDRPCVPLLKPHTCLPIDITVPYTHGTGSYPKVTPLDGSLPPRTAQIDRALMHSPMSANVLSIFEPSDKAQGARPFSKTRKVAHAADTLSRS